MLYSPKALILAALLGYLMNMAGLEKQRKLIANANVYLLLPLLMFSTFVKRGLLACDITVFAVTVTSILISTPILLYAYRRKNYRSKASLLITSLFVNAVNIPFPLLLALRGEYSYAAVYAVASTLLLSIYAPTLALPLRVGGSRKRLVRETLKLLTPVYGAIAGCIVHGSGVTLPASVMHALDFSGGIAVLSITLVAGMSMPRSLKGIKRIREVTPVLVWRHLVSPLLTLLLIITYEELGFSLTHEAFAQLIVESIMPPALITASFSLSYGFDEDLTAKAILVSTPVGTLLGAVLAALL